MINGSRLSTVTIKNVTYIAVAEYRSIAEKFEDKTAIFRFTPDEGLKIIQRIDVEYATDAVFW